MARYKIGTQFFTRGKHSRLATITDIHTTLNSKGETVKVRYVAEYEFMGQILTDNDVRDTEIAMGLHALSRTDAMGLFEIPPTDTGENNR